MHADEIHPGMKSMRCMEIHGGNQAIEETFDAPGLNEWVYSRPVRGGGRWRGCPLPLACAEVGSCRG